MRTRTLLASAAGVILVAGLALPASAVSASNAPTDTAQTRSASVAPGAGLFGPHALTAASPYTYVFGRQDVATDGASVSLEQAEPSLANGDYHSLAELAVQSADGNQIVEIGWTVDLGLNGDTTPHLFVYHWVDRQASCYNGCGFVSTSDTVHAGDPVAVGATGTYRIVHVDGQWQTWYSGTEVGYFPDSLWDNGYTRAGLVQTFGEVSSATAEPCTDMGNGTFGDAAGSTQVSDFGLVNGAAPAALSVSDTNSAYYDHGAATATAFRFGGPGAC